MHNPDNKFRVKVNGIMVSYTEFGKEGAPFLIFIHGFPFNMSMWNIQAEALKDKYHIIAYDIRGHGNSDAGNENFSIELFVRDLIGLMDVLKLSRTILCGLSMGGYISLNAISNFPERFEALILCDTQCIPDTPEVKEKRMNAIRTINENGVAVYAEGSLKGLFASESFITREKEVADVRKMILNTSEESLCNTLIALSKRKETCSILNKVKVPALIIVGKEDILTPPEQAEYLNKNIKNSTLHIVEHAGHLSNLENPGNFNLGLEKFLSKIY